MKFRNQTETKKIWITNWRR